MPDAAITPVAPFNLIIDTDFGLIRLIKEKYRDPSVFNTEMLSLDNASLIKSLIEREIENPLSIVMKEYDEKIANEFYNDFMKEQYAEILKRSPVTGIGRYYSLLVETEQFNPYIWCTEEEKNHLVNVYETVNKCITVNEDILDCKICDPVFIKYPSQMDKMKNFVGKNIYIARYRFNVFYDDKGKENLSDKYNSALLRMNRCSGIIGVYEGSMLEK